MLEEIQKNTLLGLQWDPNWNCQEVWSSYLHPSEYSRWSSQGGGWYQPPPGSDRVKQILDKSKLVLNNPVNSHHGEMYQTNTRLV